MSGPSSIIAAPQHGEAEGCVAEVAAAFGIAAGTVAGPSRQRGVTTARQAALWVLRRRFPALTWEALAALVARHHASAIHGVAAAEERRARDAAFRALTDALAEPVAGGAGARRAAIEVLAARFAAPRAARPVRTRKAPPAPAPMRARNDFGGSRHPEVMTSTDMENMIRSGSRRLAAALARRGVVAA